MIDPQQQASNPEDIYTKPPEQVAEFKFVGFEQPKDSGLWAFVKKHKFRTALSSLFAVVLVTFVGILLISRSSRQLAPTQLAEKTQANQRQSDEATKQVAAAEVVNPNDISAREFSLQTSDRYFELVSKSGDVWLTRSDVSWQETVSWGDWLFFGAKRGGKIGVEAFHLGNKTFLPVAEIAVDNLANVSLRMRVENEFMYVELASDSGAGSTHRCVLNEQKACSNMQLFYNEAGSVRLLNPAIGIVMDRSKEATAGIVRVRKLDIATGAATDITNLQSTDALKQVVGAVSADELLWVATIENGVVTQLQAIDFTGAPKFILPAQTFPIASAKLDILDSYSATGVELHNTTQSVVFDVQTKQFGAPKSYVAAPDDGAPKTDIRKIIDISTRLDLPDDFVLRTAQ